MGPFKFHMELERKPESRLFLDLETRYHMTPTNQRDIFSKKERNRPYLRANSVENTRFCGRERSPCHLHLAFPGRFPHNGKESGCKERGQGEGNVASQAVYFGKMKKLWWSSDNAILSQT